MKKIIRRYLFFLAVIMVAASVPGISFADTDTGETGSWAKAHELLDAYGDVEFYKTNPCYCDEQTATELKEVAEDVVSGCSTDYDKIKAICEFVADNIYYDYDYYTGVTHTVYVDEGDVWKHKHTICDGYAKLSRELLNDVGISCIYLCNMSINEDPHEAHAFNAAYDSQNKHWIIFDATWCSNNSYSGGKFKYNGHNTRCFDMTDDYLDSIDMHEMADPVYLMPESSGVRYSLRFTNEEEWKNTDLWQIMVCGAAENTTNADITDSIMSIPVTSIRKFAFHEHNSLKSVSIPDSITSIESDAFFRCRSLEKVLLPNNITSIEDSVFVSCTALREINIPDSVTSIGECAFTDCTALPEITIPGNVSSIGSGAFAGCTALPEVTIPDSVSSIGSNAFAGCTALPEVTIPDSVTSIGKGAFSYCTALTKVTIPDSVDSIEDDTFAGCTALPEITIPGSIKSIGKSAFENCSVLAEITIPGNVASIGDNAFHKCTGLSKLTISKGVNSIGDHAFEECKSLTDVFIPGSVSAIGCNAFSLCTGLKKVTIPESITSIEYEVFSYCENLEELSIPGSVTSIGKSAFLYCTGLTHITIPGSVTSIGRGAFESCEGLQSVVIPGSVTSVPEIAFNNCISLKKVTFKKGITAIGDLAFSGCDMNAISLPASLISIGGGAFSGCPLQKVKIPDGVTTIGSRAFDRCRILYEITIPGSVTSIGENAFRKFDGSFFVTKNSYAEKYLRNNGFADMIVYRCYPDHTWKTSYTVDVPATYARKGSKSIHCSVCGAVKTGSTVTIPKRKVKAAKITKVTGAKKGFAVKWRKVSGVSGYEIQYALNSKFTKSKKSVKIKKPGIVSKKVTKLKAGKKYYIRIRAYKTYRGKKYCSAWSKTRKVKTR